METVFMTEERGSECQELWRGWDLSCLQAYVFVCHSFMNIGKRQETPGSEAKDFIANSNRGNPIPVSVLFC